MKVGHFSFAIGVFLYGLPVSLFLVIGFTGCGKGCDANNEPEKKSNLEIARDVAQDIMDCFINKDEEELYLMLSKNAQDFYMTKGQIKSAFDFIDGEIISYKLPTDTGGGGESVEHGKVTAQDMTPWITNIKTTSGNNYRITFQYFTVVNKYVENMKGLNDIFVSILDENESLIKRIVIGFDNSDDEYDIFQYSMVIPYG